MIAEELADRIHVDKREWPQWLDAELDDQAAVREVQHQGRYDDSPIVSVYLPGRAQAYDLLRYEFEDGSAIVVSADGGWDVEGVTPFSWAGA